MKKLIGLVMLIAGLAALAQFGRKWLDENRDLVSDNMSKWTDIANEKASQTATMIRDQSKSVKGAATDAASAAVDMTKQAANSAHDKVNEVSDESLV